MSKVWWTDQRITGALSAVFATVSRNYGRLPSVDVSRSPRRRLLVHPEIFRDQHLGRSSLNESLE